MQISLRPLLACLLSRNLGLWHCPMHSAFTFFCFFRDLALSSQSFCSRCTLAVWVILSCGDEREPSKKVQCIQLPPPTLVRQKLTPGSLERGYHITQGGRNSQGHGNSGLSTPCDIIPSDTNPLAGRVRPCPSLFCYQYAIATYTILLCRNKKNKLKFKTSNMRLLFSPPQVLP